MAGEFSFDVVSEYDVGELRNVPRPGSTGRSRRGTTSRAEVAEITLEKDALLAVSDSELRLRADPRPRRVQGHPPRALTQGLRLGTPEEAGGNRLRQHVGLRRACPTTSSGRSARSSATNSPG